MGGFYLCGTGSSAFRLYGHGPRRLAPADIKRLPCARGAHVEDSNHGNREAGPVDRYVGRRGPTEIGEEIHDIRPGRLSTEWIVPTNHCGSSINDVRAPLSWANAIGNRMRLRNSGATCSAPPLEYARQSPATALSNRGEHVGFERSQQGRSRDGPRCCCLPATEVFAPGWSTSSGRSHSVNNGGSACVTHALAPAILRVLHQGARLNTPAGRGPRPCGSGFQSPCRLPGRDFGRGWRSSAVLNQ